MDIKDDRISRPVAPGSPSPGAEPAAASLDALFIAMRSPVAEEAQAAWGEVYRRYHQRVWARVFYVIRTVPWLREPREVASDVAAQVFLGLPAALARYQDVGRPEQWLLRVALRTALRHRETLTGNWAGRTGGRSEVSDRPRRGRSFLDLDDAVDEVAGVMEEVEQDDRLELRRRLESWAGEGPKARWLPYITLFLEGYSHEELAERLGISVGTSRTWLWQIRQALAQPPESPGMTDEVGGRGDNVLPITGGASSHPDRTTLEQFADGLLAADPDAAVAAHLARCADCVAAVSALRRGLAVLAIGSTAPAGLAEQVREGRAAGTVALLPVEPPLDDEVLREEIGGRDGSGAGPEGHTDPAADQEE